MLASGPPKDLRSKNVFDENDLADHAEDDAHHETEEAQANEDGSVPVAVEQQLSSDPAADEAQKQADMAKLQTKKLVKDEESATGAISAKIYALYIGAMGSLLFWVALVAVFFGSQGLQVGVNFWLQRWAKSYDPQVESASFLTFMLAPVAQSILALSPSDDENNDVSILSSFKDDQTNYYLAWYLVLNLIYLVSIAVRMVSRLFSDLPWRVKPPDASLSSFLAGMALLRISESECDLVRQAAAESVRVSKLQRCPFSKDC